MKKINIKNPWDVAYELCKDQYSKADIDDMLFSEIKEIIGYDE
jgi:hypothetical protein